MKSVFKALGIILVIILCIVGCTVACTGAAVESVDKALKSAEEEKSNLINTVSKQYKDYYSYYIEGTIENKNNKDYDYLQIQFICYDKNGNNLGDAVANTSLLLANQTWIYKAMYLGSYESNIDHCDFSEITGW